MGVKTIIYPVKDLKKARTSFINILGADPYTDNPYYVGFRVEDQEIGLDPAGHKEGMTAYYTVADITKMKKFLLENGAKVIQDIKDVGGGGLIASLRDSEGNIIGLMQDS